MPESGAQFNLAEFQKGDWVEARTPVAATPQPLQQLSAPASPASISHASTISRLPFVRRRSMSDHPTSHLASKRHVVAVVSFILMLGIIGGLLNYASKRSGYGLLSLRHSLAATVDSTVSSASSAVLWTVFSTVLLFLAIVWTNISPSAIGSGLPQTKVVLTGVDPTLYLPGYFTLATFVAKFGGLVLSSGAGLVLGTEGAWTHLVSIIVHHLLRFPCFASINSKQSTRLQLLAAAAAIAVSSTFASPMGGVLFSIEVTATYYLISNYTKAFVGAVGAAFVVQAIMALVHDTALVAYPTDFPSQTAPIVNLPLAIPLALFLGTLSALLIDIVRRIGDLRYKARRSPIRAVRLAITWLDPLVIVVATSIWSFFSGNAISDTRVLKRYFVNDTTLDLAHVAWHGALFPLVLLPFTITLAVPSGVGLPTFAIGAALGRLYGEMLVWIWPHAGIVPAAYALIGAACLTGSATRTISTAVIALESTASLQYMLPVFSGTLAAIAASVFWKRESIYDATVVAGELPYMPCLDFSSDMTTTADDIKDPNVVYVTRKPTIMSILVALHRLPGHSIPVVESETNRMLLGCISSSALQAVVAHYYDKHELGDSRADCGLTVDACEVNGGGTTTWTSLKSSLHRSEFSRNSIDRIYCSIENESVANRRDAGLFAMHDAHLMSLLSMPWGSKKREALRQAKTKLPPSAVQPLPITVASNTLLEDMHKIFLMLRIDHCYVTHHGALVGVVTTHALIQASKHAP
ncbi:hypothetical protein AeNC1_007366 [Aphanomyces euteiches]|nr:hypothetical protein AeNC1_007366 [Aphanomyces euteiches]